MMAHRTARADARRGSTLVESAVVATGFVIFLAGVMEFGRIGFAYNEVSFAAQRAARFAAVRGSTSGHPASSTDVQNEALVYSVALDTTKLTVTTTWTPDNKPGSSVKVKVAYNFVTPLVPISKATIALQATAQEVITQ